MTRAIARDPILSAAQIPVGDHRALRTLPMLALKSFRTAAITLAGVELAHRIRKRQFSFGRGGARPFYSLKHLWAHALERDDTVLTHNRHCTRTQVHPC